MIVVVNDFCCLWIWNWYNKIILALVVNDIVPLPMKEIIFGSDCVRIALSGYRRQIYKLLIYQSTEKKNNNSDHILELAQKRLIPLQHTTRKELDILLCDRPHQVRFY